MSNPGYITLSDLKATLNLTGNDYADSDLTAAIMAASYAVDKMTNRRFWLDAGTDNVRLYTPERGQLHSVDIDDLVVLTSLKTDEDGSYTYADSWVQNRDFMLAPYNAAADGEPWTSFEVLKLTTQYQLYPWIPASIQITGQFGWPTIPNGVVEATTILSARLFKLSREAPFGIASYGDAVMRIAKNDPGAVMLLSPYNRWPKAVG